MKHKTIMLLALALTSLLLFSGCLNSNPRNNMSVKLYGDKCQENRLFSLCDQTCKGYVSNPTDAMPLNVKLRIYVVNNNNEIIDDKTVNLGSINPNSSVQFNETVQCGKVVYSVS